MIFSNLVSGNGHYSQLAVRVRHLSLQSFQVVLFPALGNFLNAQVLSSIWVNTGRSPSPRTWRPDFPGAKGHWQPRASSRKDRRLLLQLNKCLSPSEQLEILTMIIFYIGHSLFSSAKKLANELDGPLCALPEPRLTFPKLWGIACPLCLCCTEALFPVCNDNLL